MMNTQMRSRKDLFDLEMHERLAMGITTFTIADRFKLNIPACDKRVLKSYKGEHIIGKWDYRIDEFQLRDYYIT